MLFPWDQYISEHFYPFLPSTLAQLELETNAVLLEQSGYVTEALRHLHAAQDAAASESRENARQLSVQQQVEREQ